MRPGSLFVLLAWSTFFVVASPLCASAGSREDWAKARSKPMAEDARSLMESIFSRTEEPAFAAQAGLWLGQLEYTTGRVETALPFFRQAEALAEDPRVRAEGAFWAEHCGGLLTEVSPGNPPPSTPPEFISNASEFFRTLAMGDAEIRAGRPREALQRYLSLEGESRELALGGPLAYRIALVVAFARSAGETDPIFSWRTLDSWQSELARTPERGLITALRRREETLPSRLQDRETKAATDFAELPGPAPKRQRVLNRSFPSPDFSSPDSLRSDYRVAGDEAGERTERRRGQGASAPETVDRTSGPTRYIIQLSAHADRATARREMERMTSRGLSVRLEPGLTSDGDRVYRIRLGRPASHERQESFARRRLRGLDYQIVPVEP